MNVAHVITDDTEALAVAAELAANIRKGAAGRDALRRLPHAELERLPGSRLLAATVPAEFGGADVRADTLAEIFRLPAAADASLGQIPQRHFVYVNVLRRQGTREQQEFFLGEVLREIRTTTSSPTPPMGAPSPSTAAGAACPVRTCPGPAAGVHRHRRRPLGPRDLLHG